MASGVDQSGNDGIIVDGIGTNAVFESKVGKQIGQMLIQNYYEGTNEDSPIGSSAILKMLQDIIKSQDKLIEMLEDRLSDYEEHIYKIESDCHKLKRGKKIIEIEDIIYLLPRKDEIGGGGGVKILNK